MIYKPSLISAIAVVYLALSTCLISLSLMAQSSVVSTAYSKPNVANERPTSNLITNNPFVPKNSGTLNTAKKNSAVPKTTSSKQQVLQKYLQFKSIAIINKKKYFSIFNKRTNKSFWISEYETVENFRVTSYDQKNNTISITDGINTEVIPIITANETPLSVASAVTKPSNSEVATPPIPGATANQNKDKPKTPPRRRIVPVKR